MQPGLGQWLQGPRHEQEGQLPLRPHVRHTTAAALLAHASLYRSIRWHSAAWNSTTYIVIPAQAHSEADPTTCMGALWDLPLYLLRHTVGLTLKFVWTHYRTGPTTYMDTL